MDALGRYDLVKHLRSSAGEDVYLARARGPGQFEKLLVLKRASLEASKDPAAHERFLAEARLASRLDHPNIVQVFDCDQIDGHDCLTMEHVDGPSLGELVDACRARGEPMPVAIALHLVAQICDALAYLHALDDPETGAPLMLVHRDVGPHSIVISSNGVAKLTNFAFAREADATQTGTVRSRPAYTPPEVLGGSPRVDPRGDLYALGAVLYEALTLSPPFAAASADELISKVLGAPLVPASQLRPDLPAKLDAALARALSRDIDERPQDAFALRDALDAWLSKHAMVKTEEIVAFLRGVTGPGPAAAAPRAPDTVPVPAVQAPPSGSDTAQQLPPVEDAPRVTDKVMPADAPLPAQTLVEPSTEASAAAAPVSQEQLETRPIPRPARERTAVHAAPTAEKPEREWWMWLVLLLGGAITAAALFVLAAPAPAPPGPPAPPPRAVVKPDLAPPPPKVVTRHEAATETERGGEPPPPAAAPDQRAAPTVEVPPAAPARARLPYAPLPHRRPKKSEVLITASVNEQPVRAKLTIRGQGREYVGLTPYFLTGYDGKYEVTAEVEPFPKRHADVWLSNGSSGMKNFKMDGSAD